MEPDATYAPFFSGKEERGRVEDECLSDRFEDFEGGREPRSPDDDEPSLLGL
ncbi:hypothetical protein ASZ90_012104 [hydrocarbon metagenome]|uniref:Uncharacterized protein n=1 Tax=hydrocarbon metagenome TaxID=938273 RepID=A0A0W8FBG9_9ZZZZ